MTTEIANLDIGVVIANAGWGESGAFDDMKDDDLRGSININALQVVYLFKILGEKLMQRTKRSAMIVTSSISSAFPMPGMLTYSAGKRFVTHLAQGLNFEY